MQIYAVSASAYLLVNGKKNEIIFSRIRNCCVNYSKRNLLKNCRHFNMYNQSNLISIGNL